MFKFSFNKKLRFFLPLTIVLLLFLAGCSDETSSSQSEQITLTIGSGLPAGSYQGRLIDFFAEQVEKESNGSIVVEAHHGGSLVAIQESYEALNNNIIDMYLVPFPYFEGKIPEITPIGVPGAYNLEQFLKMDEEVAPIFDEMFKGHNMKYIFGTYQGGSITTTKKNIPLLKTKENWEGLKVRSAGPKVNTLIEELGGSPVNIPLSELSIAIQNGTVDVVYIAWPQVKSLKLYELHPNLTFLNQSALWEGMLMNLDKWNKLSPEQQEIIMQISKQVSSKSIELAMEDFEEFLNEVESQSDVTFYELQNEERKTLTTITDAIFNEVKSEANEQEMKLIEVIEKLR